MSLFKVVIIAEFHCIYIRAKIYWNGRLDFVTTCHKNLYDHTSHNTWLPGHNVVMPILTTP